VWNVKNCKFAGQPGTDLYGVARVVTIFKRRWIFHLITVFIQSILLNCLTYMTFFFKLYNFQVL
jgi:hypothetical protein